MDCSFSFFGFERLNGGQIYSMMAILSLQVADFVLPMQEFEVPTTPLSDDDLHPIREKLSSFIMDQVISKKGDTARKSLISTGWEPPVCTSFPTGTAPPVLSARALSTGQLAHLVPVGNTNRY